MHGNWNHSSVLFLSPSQWLFIRSLSSRNWFQCSVFPSFLFALASQVIPWLQPLSVLQDLCITLQILHFCAGSWGKVVITHHNMAVKDTCKPTSGSRGLLGGCCEGRGVCAWHTQFSAGICSSCAGIQAEAGLLSNGASSSWWCSTPAVPELFHGAVQALCWPAWTLHWWSNVMEPMSSVTWVWQLSRSWVQPPHCLLFHHNSSCEKGRCESLPLILN